MIAVVGVPAWRDSEPKGPSGRSCEIGIAAAGRGAAVEIVGRVGDDPAGDQLFVALARTGVGHAAVIRDPAHPTRVVAAPEPDEDLLGADPGGDPAPTGEAGPRLQAEDVALGLRYLTAFSVLVVADDVPGDVLPATVEAAAFAGAHLILVLGPDQPQPAGLPAAVTVLAAPEAADDGEFGALVGAYAAALDQGLDPPEAFRMGVRDTGWEAAGLVE